MPITISFHKLSEKKPKHQEDIIWLQQTSSFGYTGFDPRNIQAEYQWTEFDDDGNDTGSAICYHEDDKQLKNHRLDILFDGQYGTPDELWISVDDYWKCFDELKI